MTARRSAVLSAWLVSVLVAGWIVAHARYVNDLSAFLPAHPEPLASLLVEQLREGPQARVVLIALEGGDLRARGEASQELARRLRSSPEFTSVENGQPANAERDRDFLFEHRYLLSDAVDAERFTTAGLESALEQTLQKLTGAEGLLLEPMLAHDPTGELLHVLDRLSPASGPRLAQGVWASRDGTRTVLLAQTTAPGSDIDAQERALRVIRDAFAGSVPDAAAGAVHLRMSGPPVFAVAARARIKGAATRLSLLSGVLVIGVLSMIYRSPAKVGLGLLPVATGALAGIAAVALGFGSVHGVTLGFGATLIGEAVDYSIYFFVAVADSWRSRIWPTVRSGMLTSVCGFASLLPSGFPGLAQLGLYSITGLMAAALVTRFVLPELAPEARVFRPSGMGQRIAWVQARLPRPGGRTVALAACLIAGAALAILAHHRASLWSTDLAALSPISAADLRFDAMVRRDLGTADVLDLVVAEGSTRDAALRGAERASVVLQRLTESGVIGGFENPAAWLPSQPTQLARRNALPDRRALQSNVRLAAAALGIREDALNPFIEDVEAVRSAPPMGVDLLQGTSFAAPFGALVVRGISGWRALLPLRAPSESPQRPAGTVDTAAVSAALAGAGLREIKVLDVKQQSDALYTGYLDEAIHLSCGGLALILLLLLLVLRSARRVASVIAPLLLAVLTVAAALAAFHQPLTLLHLVGMLLIVAVGSNYALFFDAEGRGARDQPLVLAALVAANLCTVIAFGVLSLSQVPVLQALGVTVAPGTFLALVYASAMTGAPSTRTGARSGA